MTDYIDRAELISHIESESHAWGEEYDAEQILGDIEDFPAADVRPVVRGEWIKDKEVTMPDGYRYRQRHCSVCGWRTVETINFCQNCGADMRKEAADAGQDD